MEDLAGVRIRQKNLVYITNIPPSLTLASLSSQLYFGRYGVIRKIATRPHNTGLNPADISIVCYITYSSEKSAYTAILNTDQSLIGNNTIRVTYGTTKYCSYFLYDKKCTNSECMYLHSLSSEEDCMTKENILLNNNRTLHQFSGLNKGVQVLGLGDRGINAENGGRKLVECSEIFQQEKIITFEPWY